MTWKTREEELRTFAVEKKRPLLAKAEIASADALCPLCDEPIKTGDKICRLIETDEVRHHQCHIDLITTYSSGKKSTHAKSKGRFHDNGKAPTRSGAYTGSSMM